MRVKKVFWVPLLAFIVAALSPAAPAAARDTPWCNPDVWSRPGETRSVPAVCTDTDHARVVSQPAHGRVENEHFDGWNFTYRLVTDADAPEEDSFEVETEGSDGVSRRTISIHNIPLNVNHPPECWGDGITKRTDGIQRATLEFGASCWDPDHDDMTVHGGGPGHHLSDPSTISRPLDQGPALYMRYRPLALSGTERTTIWAVDSQGARSADAPVSFTIGPEVDRKPTCGLDLSSMWPPSFTVPTRAGRTRHFGFVCTDDDADEMKPVISVPPTGGRVTSIEPYYRSTGWALTQYYQVTYVPEPGRGSEDQFTFRPETDHGAGSDTTVHLVDKPMSENNAAGCGSGYLTATSGSPNPLPFTCSDPEGDPVTMSVVRPPAHGTLGEVTMSESYLGEPEARVTYTPDETFSGVDTIAVRGEDDQGAGRTNELEIHVFPHTAPPPISWPADILEQHYTMHPPAAASQSGSPESKPAPAFSASAQARAVLGADAVRLVRRMGTASLYSPATRPAIGPEVKALAIVCTVRCAVKSSSSVRGDRAASRQSSAASPGHPHAVAVRLTRKQRHRLRSARRADLLVRLRVRPENGRQQTASVRVPLKR